MKKITILSGKGGVGKSSITASLAVELSSRHSIICADCDVDASNLAIVLGVEEDNFDQLNPISTNQKAVFDHEKCISCRKCFDSCYFNAIKWHNHKPSLNKFGCEGCGVCELVCPAGAVHLENVENAKIGFSSTPYGFKIVTGQLGVGESGSGKIVTAVKSLAEELGNQEENKAEIMIIDSAAGIGCPVIASVSGSDYVIAVTEPTPSGFSDLKRALGIVNNFNIPCGLIINKYDINNEICNIIEDYAKKQKIKILLRIPYDKKFIDALVSLIPIIEYDRAYKPVFRDLADKISGEIL